MRKIREGANEAVPFLDFLIINVPVLLFIAGIFLSLSLFLALKPEFPLMLAFLVPAWWCVCGAVALSADYRFRKRDIYLRLRRTGAPEKGSALGKSLRRTVCGAMVLAAASRHPCVIRT